MPASARCAAKAGIEERLFEADPAEIRIDTPAGRVVASAEVGADGVGAVSFRNVPSFVAAEGREISLEGRCVPYDLAFGGAFYAYFDADDLGIGVTPAEASRLIDLGRRLKSKVAEAGPPRYPGGDPDLEFLYGAILVGEPKATSSHSRNACVFADGELDRSPTGTGVSGRAAILFARGEIALGEWITIESVIGTCFDVRVVDTATVGELPAVIPEVRGRAHVTGRHTFLIDPHDPLASGFLLR